jgi:ABC-2 type transport system ATP-binding protein
MIEVEHLSKKYGSNTAVEDVSFVCEPGTVTGFLGPNGAGKSTTMRMICGLTTPTGGRSRVDGVPYRQLPNPARHVGVLLDASAQHVGRTGREVLTVAARTIGVDQREMATKMDLVGLNGVAAKRRVKGYSLGMRQRLGLAHALLGDPRVLILDEPANGLDPEGIMWMRGLLRGFADRGGTVLLSSHLLREVAAVADRLVVIGGGRTVAEGGKDELLAQAGTLVRTAHRQHLWSALDSAGLRSTPTTDGALLVKADVPAVREVAAAAGVALDELRPAGHDGLEQLFLTLTAGNSTKEAVK